MNSTNIEMDPPQVFCGIFKRDPCEIARTLSRPKTPFVVSSDNFCMLYDDIIPSTPVSLISVY